MLGEGEDESCRKDRRELTTNHQPSGVSALCPTAFRRRTKRSERKMTHLKTRGQFIIRLRNKREVNQGNMLEK